MSSLRLLITASLLLITISFASADYSDYSIDWKILPTEIGDPSNIVAYEDTDVLIFGYITISNLNGVLSSDAFNLRIMEGSTLKKDLEFSDSALVYLNDYDDSTKLLDGFFYTKVSDFNEGVYTVIISIDGEDIDYKTFEIIDGSTDFFVDLSTVTVNKGPVLQINYTGGGTPDANLSFYGRSNFNSPTLFEVIDVSDNASPQVTGFNLNDYVGDNEVYGFVVYGEATSGDPTEPKVLVKNTGFKTLDVDGVISLVTQDLKKGDSETISLSIENNGSLPTTYNIDLSGGLSSYASVDSSVEVLPSDSETVSLTIDVPRTYSLEEDDLIISIRTGGSVVDAQTFDFDLLDADPVHSVIIEGVSLSKTYYFVGDNINGNITLFNDGDYTEFVTVEYYFQTGSINKINQVMLSAGDRKTVNFYLNAFDNLNLLFDVTNSYIDTTDAFNVNVIAKSYDFSVDFDDYMTSQGKLTETVSLIIDNTGNIDDVFVVNSDYSYIEYSTRSLSLEPDETGIIDAIINLPSDGSDLDFNFTVCSQRGDECESGDLFINVLSIGGSGNSGSDIDIDDTSLTGNTEEGVIYSFDITNNNLVTKNYELNYDSSADIDFSVYPDEDFTVQPGETKTIFLYAIPNSFGEYMISYSIMEEGAELGSGTLRLTANPGFNLTGFAVSAGSTLGFIGLIALVVFIYFYFIRGSSSGVEEFKPVEVKKADLTKPGVKNDSKYW